MSFTVRTAPSQISNTLKVFALILIAHTSAGYAASTGTSHVGVTKVATLQVAGLDNDQLTRNASGRSAPSPTCLETGGEPMPYRMSATSLRGQNAFEVSGIDKSQTIGYQVIWSDQNDQYRLSDRTDQTAVLQAQSANGCDSHMLSIEWDNEMYTSAAGGAYTDTLSLIFVIE